MAMTKFTVSESVEQVREAEKKQIQGFLKSANKRSVEELSDDEKERLQTELDRTK